MRESRSAAVRRPERIDCAFGAGERARLRIVERAHPQVRLPLRVGNDERHITAVGETANCGTDVDAAGPTRLRPGGGSIVKTMGRSGVSTDAGLHQLHEPHADAPTKAATTTGVAMATTLRLLGRSDCDLFAPSPLTIHSSCRLTSPIDCQRSSGSFARQTLTK